MVSWILKKILGSKNQREIKRLHPIVRTINEFDEQYKALSDDELRAKTAAWKAEVCHDRRSRGAGRRLDEILPEAFAVVKNAARRLTERQETFTVCDQPMTWNMVHFDVQLIGGIVLHRGRIAEMATGEGKTLVATLPLYLNALDRPRRASRDGERLPRPARRRMDGPALQLPRFDLTGASSTISRRISAASSTRWTSPTARTREFGFDYLRDNGMATTREQQVQRGYHYAIVDEVDSILIDEARTPLIISGPATVSTHQYDDSSRWSTSSCESRTCFATVSPAKRKKLSSKDEIEEGGRLMFKVKLGQPRNKQLLRMMEDPEKRKAIDKAEFSFYQDTRKEELFALKEELFFTMDEKSHEADLSEQGRAFLNPEDPDSFVLPDLISEFTDIDLNRLLSDEEKDRMKTERQEHCDKQAEQIHNISQLLRAYCLFEKDVAYVVEENKVVIVDEYTGRKMPGRRWSDGLHQAVEAKEGVQIDRETQTLATITIQNYFRLYHKLAGMTGTAETEAERIPRHLQTGCRCHPDESTGRAVRRQRPHLQNTPRKIQRRHQ